MRWIADAAYLLVGLFYLPAALYQALIVGKNRRGWRQRFGGSPCFDAARRRIWIHAVSLGEINATSKLVSAIQERLPDVDIVVSTTTDTGYARGLQLYGAHRVFRFPLDFSLVIDRALRRIQPSLIVLMELEVWYNLTRMAARRKIPVVVVNGRMTERSARRLHRLGRLARHMFGDLAWVGAQDEAIADRFRKAGVAPHRVEVTSSLKWDTAAVADQVEGADELARALGIDRTRPLWVCGSTGDNEEALILDAYQRLVIEGHAPPTLAVVPRKPERFDEVARVIESRGIVCIRRSAASSLSARETKGVILGDTMGELRKFYCLADVVFVGRSLVSMGGSDPMEVAALAKPIIVGPHMENFDAPLRALLGASAARVVASPIDLARAVDEIIADPTLGAQMGSNARRVVLQNQGATARTADRVVALLGGRTRG